MAGNSMSPDDSVFSEGYPNGQMDSYLGPSLDRSGSFRELNNGRSFSSGPSGTSKSFASAIADMPPLSQCLNLEPITMGDSKYTRTGEMRKTLGVLAFGNALEDNSLTGAQSRPSATFNIDEVKRFRSTVMDGSLRASNRIKSLDESLNKLSKYHEVFISKKQQTNDRSGGSNLFKIGSQSHRSSPELAAQKLEDRNKNIVLNKRARTPTRDLRAEGRTNGVPRQTQVFRKDKNSAKEGCTDVPEENIRRLQAGGEGWDKKMRKKRSVSSVCPRTLDGDGELKKAMPGKLGNDTSIYTSDGHGFRSGSSNGANGSNKLDGSQSSGSLGGRMAVKNESEKSSLPRELSGMNKEKLLQKGNTSSITKGKASRAHRSSPVSLGNSTPNFSRLPETPEDGEQALNVNKVRSLPGVNNRKRSLPTDSSPPMARWKGQRPQKISRTRRLNIVSPTSNLDVVPLPDQECTTLDFSSRISSGINVSLPVRNIMSCSQQLKAKLESAQSPARLSESEENSSIENRVKDKVLCATDSDEKGINIHQHAGLGLFTKKSKLFVKDDIGDGIRRQGRSGRGSSFPKGSASSLREKPESAALAKFARSTGPGSEKNGSKSGRPPLKKQFARKGSMRPGPVQNSSSPDLTGESDDDRDEILAAAQFACNASYNGCSSSFWKRWEPLFYARVEDKTFLETQLKAIENHPSNPSQMLVLDDNVLDRVSQTEKGWPHNFAPGESNISVLDNGVAEPTNTKYLIDQFQDHDSSYRGLAEKEHNKLTPLYQRVLSALIIEDEFEEYEHNHFLSNLPSLGIRDDPYTLDRGSYDGDYGLSQSTGHRGHRPYENEVNGSLTISIRVSGSFSLDGEYDQMCIDDKLLLELESIGVYPETVPDLEEGEEELIIEDIAQLKKQYFEQAEKKMAYLKLIHKAIEKDVKGRDLEEVALDRLTELAFRKLLATRGNSAARSGISKVPKHVALAFAKRTLARYEKYKAEGKSCFSEPALRDILLAVPSNNSGSDTGMLAENRLKDRASGGYPRGTKQLDLQNDKSESSPIDAAELLSQSDSAFAKNGPILIRGKKKEVFLDDVDGNASLTATPSLKSTLSGGAKGKRSERDSSAKPGRPSLLNSNSKGERKTKYKPRQKVAQLSTHPVQPNGSISDELVTNTTNGRQVLKSPGNILDSSKESNEGADISSLPLTELDSIEDLNVGNEFEGHQDLSSWLNLDEVDGLQDDDDIMGLQIPMDDLSDLNMLL